MLGQVKCNNRLAQRHVFHDFEHRRAVGIGIGGRGVYANIGSGEKLTEFFAENRTREAHMVLQGKFPRQSLQIFKRVTKANDYAIEIVPPKTAKEVIQRPQEIVHSILNAHHAYVPDNGLSPLPQLLIGFDGNHGATQFNAISNDGNSLLWYTSAAHRDFPVRLIRDNDLLGEPATQLFEHDKRAMDEGPAPAAEPGQVHFRGQVVMVVNKTFAE